MSAAIAGDAASTLSAIAPATSLLMTPPLYRLPADCASVPDSLWSEVPNHVCREQPHVVFVGRDWHRRRIEVAVECRCIVGLVVGHFGTHLDLRREPVLPAETNVGIAGSRSCALALLVVVILGAQRNIVPRRDLVVPIGQRGLRACGARDRIGVAALREERSIELDVSRSKGKTAGGYDAGRIRTVQHIPLKEVVEFERDVKPVVELVVPGHSIPLKIVIAPGAIVDRISTKVDIVIG